MSDVETTNADDWARKSPFLLSKTMESYGALMFVCDGLGNPCLKLGFHRYAQLALTLQLQQHCTVTWEQQVQFANKSFHLTVSSQLWLPFYASNQPRRHLYRLQ